MIKKFSYLDALINNFLFHILPVFEIGFKIVTPVFFIGYFISEKSIIKNKFKAALDVNAILFATISLIAFLLYWTEFYIAYRSGFLYEENEFASRAFGPFRWAYWAMMLASISTLVLNTLLFIKKIRDKTWYYLLVWVLSFTSLGVLIERAIILIVSLLRDYISSSWTLHTLSINRVFVGLIVSVFVFFIIFVIRIQLIRKK